MEDAAQCLPDPCSDGLTRSAMDAPLAPVGRRSSCLVGHFFRRLFLGALARAGSQAGRPESPFRNALAWRAFDHPMTSSALARKEGGRSSPRAFAVLRLITSATLVGCCTGRSPGLAPFTIWWTKPAARRQWSASLGP